MSPVRSADADEEKPFSELMLEWLEEGDKMADAPPDGARPHAPLTPASRAALGGVFKRDRALIVGATLVAAVAVLVLRLVGSSAPAAPPEVASGPPPRELAQPVPAARVANVIVGEPSFTIVPHKSPPAARAPAGACCAIMRHTSLLAASIWLRGGRHRLCPVVECLCSGFGPLICCLSSFLFQLWLHRLHSWCVRL